jgi:hypothetical protein
LSSKSALVVVAIVAAMVYANALANGFVLDDRGVIMRNVLVNTPSSWWRAFGAPYWPEAVGGGQYRPLAIVSYSLDWGLSGGTAWWFHLVTIMWHVVAVVLVTVFALELMRPVGALAAGLFFAVHPVHVEAVANVVGRAESMAAVGVLAALLLHRRGSALAILAFAAALFTKEHAVVFLPLAVLHDVLIPARPRDRATMLRYAAYCGVLVGWVAVVAAIFHDRVFHLRAAVYIGVSTADRLTTVLSVIPHYARLLLFPWNLASSYEPQVIPLAHGTDGDAILGLLLLGATVAVGIAAWRRSKVVAFALLWIPIAIAPVANVFVVTGVALAERTLYVASIGACWLLGLTVDFLVVRRRTLALVPVAALSMAFAVRTWTRTPTWRDDRIFLLTLLSTHPESYWAHYLAGGLYVATGDLDAAARELAIARSLCVVDAGLLRTSAQVALDRGALPEARGLLDSARVLAPRDPRVVELQARLSSLER